MKTLNMQHSYTQAHPQVEVRTADDSARNGAALSIAGLVIWLLAMVLAVAGPLLGVTVPPLLIIGMVVFSGLFSLLSLPRMLGVGDDAE